MKKSILFLFLFLNGIMTMAQNTPAEKHLYKAFDAVKNKDAKAYKLLWPDQKTLSEIMISSSDFNTEQADDTEVFMEIQYHRMMGKLLENFMEIKTMNTEVNWKDLYIEKVHIDKNASQNSEGIIEYDGVFWLKSHKNKNKNYALSFTDLIEFKGQWYGAVLQNVIAFENRFEDFILNEEDATKNPDFEEEIAYEAATEAAISAAESAATIVDLPVLEQTIFSTTINSKKMILNWKVNGWEDDKIYDQTTYQYQNQEEQSFAEIVVLDNGYILMIEENRKNFFRIKNTYGSLSGTYFSTQSGKEIPVVFASTEVKK